MACFLPFLDLGASPVVARHSAPSFLPFLHGMGAGANRYTELLRAPGRMPFYVVEIETDKRCSLTWGTHPCPATGGSDGAYCYHSFNTCPTAATKAAFTPSSYIWRFASNHVPLHAMTSLLSDYGGASSSQAAIFPLVNKVDFAAAQVDIEAGFTRRGKATITMQDTGVLSVGGVQSMRVPGFDLDKSVRNTSAAGSWWLRWLAQWPNHRNMKIRIKRGFFASDFPADDLETCFTGLVESIARDAKGEIRISTTDYLEPLTKKIPLEVGTRNALAADVSRSATSWTVEDASYFTDPSSLVSGGIFLEAATTTGRSEIVQLTARDTGAEALTVTRAMLGTYAEPIRMDTPLREVLAFGTGDGLTEGRPMAIIRSLLERVGLPAATFVDEASFADAERQIGPVALRRVVREPTACNELINELCQLFQLALFAGEDGRIVARCNFPAMPGETIPTVTDARNVLAGTGAQMVGERQRLTHVRVYYDYEEDGAGDWAKDGGVSVYINGTTFSAKNYGSKLEDIQDKSIEARWLRGDDDDLASWVASAWGVRFGSAPLRFTWSAELRDATYDVGDLVDITSIDLLDAHGATKVTRALIIEKKPTDMHGFAFVAQTYGILPTSQGGKRIALVAHDGQADYGSASDTEKLYWYIGSTATDADSDGVVDTTATGDDDGYYLA